MLKFKKKIFVAMSGGVDSSVAAGILKKKNYKIQGVFLNLGQVNFKEALKSAKKVAQKISIDLKILDLRKEFRKRVINSFLKGYSEGITPNPCVTCNKKIKFNLLLKTAKRLKFDYLATGHYVRLQRDLKIAKDKSKDQSYFLYNLTQKQLKNLLFPLGNYTKEEVKKIADKWHLPYFKKESQDICFLPSDHNEFLRKNLKLKKGLIITSDGKKIGYHEGLALYTIGQRHGFGLGGGVPYYVVAKNIKKNLLIVAKEKEEKKFYKKEVLITNVNWIFGKPPDFSKRYSARIRYRQPLQSCKIENCKLRIENSKNYKVIFRLPQRAVTPGQSLVIYHSQKLIGGGIIKN